MLSPKDGNTLFGTNRAIDISNVSSPNTISTWDADNGFGVAYIIAIGVALVRVYRASRQQVFSFKSKYGEAPRQVEKIFLHVAHSRANNDWIAF